MAGPTKRKLGAAPIRIRAAISSIAMLASADGAAVGLRTKRPGAARRRIRAVTMTAMLVSRIGAFGRRRKSSGVVPSNRKAARKRGRFHSFGVEERCRSLASAVLVEAVLR